MAPTRSAALLLLLGAPAVAAGGASKKATPPRYGGEPVKKAFKVWLSSWRNLYADPQGEDVPELPDDILPDDFAGIKPKVVISAGGFAGGVVTEGMGYAIMIEGIRASQGDGWAKELGLGLLRSWMGMVQGSDPDPAHALGGSSHADGSAEVVDSYPYGKSVIPGKGPGGVATWKFPRKSCAAQDPWKPCHGSAADGDVDAVLGMLYLAGALGYPEDFVDLCVRTVIAFASADLGFPDMYRILPDGKRVYVPKAGSQWGGLTPPGGKFSTNGPEWCYNPAYFAPGHYRTFRDFINLHWQDKYNDYLPHHLDGKPTTSKDLAGAFDGAVLAGYNILYYSSCESGTVANWVGVSTPCESDDDLSCKGVPWQYTPYVGKPPYIGQYGGQCSTSGTKWGAFGADASRTFWRLAMDYVLHTEESEDVDVYWRSGWVNGNITFNARIFLNRIATQYRRYASCDGSARNGCDCHYKGCKENATEAFQLAKAFEVTKWPRTPGLTCDNVPHHGQAWWAGFMAYPTFTAFVAPVNDKVEFKEDNVTLLPMNKWQSMNWMDAFANICNFSNFTEEGGWKIFGKVCQTTYFHVSQEAISTMIMSGSLTPLPHFDPPPTTTTIPTTPTTSTTAAPSHKSHSKASTEKMSKAEEADHKLMATELFHVETGSATSWTASLATYAGLAVVGAAAVSAIAASLRSARSSTSARAASTWEQGPLLDLEGEDISATSSAEADGDRA